MTTPTKLKPALKWAGGKSWLVDKMCDYWSHQPHKRLVEPFVGAGAIALGIKPESALLNDINPHLINFWKWLQKGLAIDSILVNDADFFYLVRERFNKLIVENRSDTQNAAEWFYYLNKQGFNGLCRFNQSGLFNVPFGKYSKLNTKQDLREYVPVIQDWEFTCTDFSETEIKDGDFIYVDPPYDVEFTQYSKEVFNWNEQVRLAEWLKQSEQTVFASNQATPRILELYGDFGFEILQVEAPRCISCKGDRTPAQEIVAYRYSK
ncbi:DNA adenine methylase [Scytonema sp. NUACC26]|uniref:DNA adenine methylase n=1 Tax=Scytonema sp. NUACC26 TaxID=3140176 RepID=UPI0034DC7AE0